MGRILATMKAALMVAACLSVTSVEALQRCYLGDNSQPGPLVECPAQAHGCSKVMTTFSTPWGSTTMTVRSCYDGDDFKCGTTTAGDTVITYCNCREDGCNKD